MEQERSGLGHWLVQLFVRYFKDGCSYRAAYLAYLTLISLVPMLAISVTILSGLPVFNEMVANWQSWLISSFLVGETTSIKPLIGQLIQHAVSMSMWHITIFLVITLLMMINIGRAFRSIWHTGQRFSLTFSFLIYFLVLLLSPILLALLFVTGGLLNHWISLMVEQSGYLSLIPVVQISSYILLFIWLFLMNWVLPACRVPFKSAFISGLLTTLFLGVARYGFGIFITYFSSYKALYGSLSVIPVFLVWLYVSWMLILLGALIGNTAFKRKCSALRG